MFVLFVGREIDPPSLMRINNFISIQKFKIFILFLKEQSPWSEKQPLPIFISRLPENPAWLKFASWNSSVAFVSSEKIDGKIIRAKIFIFKLKNDFLYGIATGNCQILIRSKRQQTVRPKLISLLYFWRRSSSSINCFFKITAVFHMRNILQETNPRHYY